MHAGSGTSTPGADGDNCDGSGGGQARPPTTRRSFLQRRFQDRSKAGSTVSDSASINPKQGGALSRLGSRMERRLKPGKAEANNRPPLPASAASPPQGSLTPSGDTPTGGDREFPPRIVTPGERIRVLDDVRDRVPVLWSAKSYPRMVRGHSSASGYTTPYFIDGDRGFDTTSNSSNNGSGAPWTGDNTPVRPRKRSFLSIPSPVHLRRSISVISTAASRVANGVMTPSRRRKHGRQDSGSVQDECVGVAGGSRRARGDGASGDGRGGRRSGGHCSRRTNVSRPYASPVQTGGVSPEEESPVQHGGGIEASSPTLAREVVSVEQASKPGWVVRHTVPLDSGDLSNGTGGEEKGGDRGAPTKRERTGRHRDRGLRRSNSGKRGERRSKSRSKPKRSSTTRSSPSRKELPQLEQPGGSNPREEPTAVEWCWGKSIDSHEETDRVEDVKTSCIREGESADGRDCHSERINLAEELPPIAAHGDIWSVAVVEVLPPPHPISSSPARSVPAAPSPTVRASPSIRRRSPTSAGSSRSTPMTPQGSSSRKRGSDSGTTMAIMFASSPRGARATRRAQIYNVANKTSSSSAEEEDKVERPSSTVVVPEKAAAVAAPMSTVKTEGRSSTANPTASAVVSDVKAARPIVEVRPEDEADTSSNEMVVMISESSAKASSDSATLAGILRDKSTKTSGLVMSRDTPLTLISDSPRGRAEGSSNSSHVSVRSQFPGQPRNPPPPQADSDLVDQAKVAVTMSAARVSAAPTPPPLSPVSTVASHGRSHKVRLFSPPPPLPPRSTASLASSSLQPHGSPEPAEFSGGSGSSGLDDDRGEHDIQTHRRSGSRSSGRSRDDTWSSGIDRRENYKGKQERASGGSSHDLPGTTLTPIPVALRNRSEYSGEFEAEQQSSPDSLLSETGLMHFAGIARSIARRSRSNGSDFSISSDSTNETTSSTAATVQRRHAEVIAAARYAMHRKPKGVGMTRGSSRFSLEPEGYPSSSPMSDASNHVEAEQQQKENKPLASIWRSDPGAVKRVTAVIAPRPLGSPSPAKRVESLLHPATTVAPTVAATGARTNRARPLDVTALSVITGALARRNSTARDSSSPGKRSPTSSAKSQDLPPKLPSQTPRLDASMSLGGGGGTARVVPGGSVDLAVGSISSSRRRRVHYFRAQSTPVLPPNGGDGAISNQAGEDDMVGYMPRLERAVDDPPPAEMGALCSSLSCALCGAVESKLAAFSRSLPVRRSPGWGEVAADGCGELEFIQCSRCRRGACASCFRRLPVYCRGPRVVVPVCEDCFRPVDFMNRWHNHLVEHTRERGGSHDDPLPGGGDTRNSASSDSTVGGKGERQRRDSSASPTAVKADKNVAEAADDSGVGSGVVEPQVRPPSAAWRATSTAASFLRRSLSSGGESPSPARKVGRGSPGPGPSKKLADGRGQGGGDIRAPSESSRSLSLPRRIANAASESTWTSLASSPGLALPALNSPSVGGGVGGAGNKRPATAGSVISSFASVFSSQGGSTSFGMSSPQSTTSPPSASPESASPASRGSDAFGKSTKLDGVDGAGGGGGPADSAATSAELDLFSGALGIGAVIDEDEGRVLAVHGQGRHPSECPCGAATLYLEVTEVHPEQSTVAGTAEHAVVPGAKEAEAEASAAEAKAAAYKLRRAKAHAHLLTRGAKALVYSKLQSQAFEFLCATASAAEKSCAELSPMQCPIVASELELPASPEDPAPTAAAGGGGGGVATSPSTETRRPAETMGFGFGSEEDGDGLLRPTGQNALLSTTTTVAAETNANTRDRQAEAEGFGRRRSNSMPRAGMARDGVWSEVLAIAPGTVRQAVHKLQQAEKAARAVRVTAAGDQHCPTGGGGGGGGDGKNSQPSDGGIVITSPVPAIAGDFDTHSTASETENEVRRRAQDSVDEATRHRRSISVPVLPQDVDSVFVGSAEVPAAAPPDDTRIVVEDKYDRVRKISVASGVRVNVPTGGTEGVMAPAPIASVATEKLETSDRAVAHLDRELPDTKQRDRRRIDLVVKHVEPAQPQLLGTSRSAGTRNKERTRPSFATDPTGGRHHCCASSGDVGGSIGTDGDTEVTEAESRFGSPSSPPEDGASEVVFTTRDMLYCGSDMCGTASDAGFTVSSRGINTSDIGNADSDAGYADLEFSALKSGSGVVTRDIARAAPRNGGGGGGGLLQVFSFFDRQPGEEMLRYVKEREALFEKMISGPGISATKYPRRGKPRNVLLTLTLPEGDVGSPVNTFDDNWSRDEGSWSSGSLVAAAAGASERIQYRSLKSLENLHLVWNRKGRGSGSLRVAELVNIVTGPKSAVLRPVNLELCKRASKHGSVKGEAETYASLLTGRRSLHLKFSTPLARDRFVSAFETFAWETDKSTAKHPHILRHYARRRSSSTTANPSVNASLSF